ncbi:MAG: hypothetical protein MJ016_02370 [Victivallaceae bacterium]|nr:hypothetical protein [Victivallaceae bacterium]
MLLDLYYRLTLAEEDFQQIGDAWYAASSVGSCPDRVQAISGINAYARSLRIIENDLRLLTDGEAAVFPAELGDWMLESPDVDDLVATQLARLLRIVQALKAEVRNQLTQKEETR